MRATRDGVLRGQGTARPLGAATLRVALVAVLLFVCTTGLESRAAAVAVERGGLPGSSLRGILFVPINALLVPTRVSPHDGAWTNQPDVLFDWEPVDGAVYYDLRVDGVVHTVYAPATSMVLSLADGPHTWAVEARKNPGTGSGYDPDWTVNVDTTPPPVPTLSAPANGTATRYAQVSFSWQDVGADAYDLRVDENMYEIPNGATLKILQLGEGAHSWTVRSRDAVGNASAYAAEWTVTVDTTPPLKPALQSPGVNAISASSRVQFSWSAVEGAAVYDLRVGGLVTTTTGTSRELPLADGAYLWSVQARDWVGNASGYTAERALTVDTQRPLATIVAPANGAVLTTTHRLSGVTIRGTASDAGAGLDRVEVNTGAGWQPAVGTGNWTYAWPLPAVDNLPRTLSVQSFDRAGNASQVAQVSVTLDTVGPTCAPPVPDRSPWVTSTVAYTWPGKCADASGILRYWISMTSTGGFYTVFNTTNTEYLFSQATQERESYYARLIARDGRGNWGIWSGRSDVAIPDLTAPTTDQPSILVDSPYLHAVGNTLHYTNTMIFAQDFEVRGYAEDDFSGVDRVCFSAAFGDQPSCDSTGFSPWQSGIPGYAVDPGTTASGTIVATVYDKAGNTARQEFQYELDGTPPQSSASSQDYATTSPIRVGWTASDAQSGVHSLELWYKRGSGSWKYWSTQPAGGAPFEFSPPGDLEGTYYFVTVGHDNLGNRERRRTTPDTQTVYDTSTPRSEVTSAPAYWNASGTPITISWSAVPTLAPLVEVRLWVRYNEGAWTATSISRTGRFEDPITGQFSFDLPNGDGRYDFDTVARDDKDSSEAEPFGSGDRTAWYDRVIDSPVELKCVPAGWSQVGTVGLRWENPEYRSDPDYPSGIAAAYYKVGASPAGPSDGTRVAGDELEQIEGILLPNQGQHTVWVWLEDRAGNADHTRAATTICKYDASVGAPSGLASVPPEWTSDDEFAVTWSNPSDLSGIAGAWWKLDGPPDGQEDGTWKAGPALNRIGGIQVSGEGPHVLYLWLGDVAGNNGYANRRTVTLHYDPTLPTEVAITAPVTAALTSFVVSWSANGAESGIAGYTVEYSGGLSSEWQEWLPLTTGTSGLFKAPLADTTYDFRVTAHDRAENSAQAQTKVYVERQHIFLPLLGNRSRDWYRYDVYEPNDTLADAHGPLISGTTYESYIWNAEDPEDIYYIVPNTAQRVEGWLTDIPDDLDYDLDVWYVDGRGDIQREVGSYGTGRSEHVSFTPNPGTLYYVRVLPRRGGYNSTQPYRLRVSYN